MSRKLRYSTHALQRIAERGILRRWVLAAVSTSPACYGRHAVFVLSAEDLCRHFGLAVADGICVVVDRARAVVVTVHWLSSVVR